LAVFRTENKSKSSNIFTNKYEWKRYSKCLYLYIFISIQDTSPHIQNKSLTENMPFFYACKVKLLFGGTQLNKEKKLTSLLHLRHTISFSRAWGAVSVLHTKLSGKA